MQKLFLFDLITLQVPDSCLNNNIYMNAASDATEQNRTEKTLNKKW